MPDNGILKKSYLRVFNALNQYVVFGLLYTILGLCIIKPLFCLFMISLTLSLAMLSFPLAIVFITIRYFWNILILNLHVFSNLKCVDYLPLLTITISYIFMTMRVIIFILFITILHPLWSFIIVLFGSLTFFISTIYNEFILILIKVIGRSPVG